MRAEKRQIYIDFTTRCNISNYISVVFEFFRGFCLLARLFLSFHFNVHFVCGTKSRTCTSHIFGFSVWSRPGKFNCRTNSNPTHTQTHNTINLNNVVSKQCTSFEQTTTTTTIKYKWKEKTMKERKKNLKRISTSLSVYWKLCPNENE